MLKPIFRSCNQLAIYVSDGVDVVLSAPGTSAFATA